MDVNLKKIASDRRAQFLKECGEHKISLSPMTDAPKLTSVFNQMVAEQGEAVRDFSFEDVLNAMGGTTIKAIADYIAKMERMKEEKEAAAWKAAEAEPKDADKPSAKDPEPRPEKKSEDPQPSPAKPQPAERPREKDAKKEKQDFGNLDNLLYGETNDGAAAIDELEKRKIEKKIKALERERLTKISTVSSYRKDMAVWSAVARYGKAKEKQGESLEVCGLKLDCVCQVLAAATKLLSGELSKLGDEKLVKAVREELARLDKEMAPIDREIESLRKKLQL